MKSHLEYCVVLDYVVDVGHLYLCCDGSHWGGMGSILHHVGMGKL